MMYRKIKAPVGYALGYSMSGSFGMFILKDLTQYSLFLLTKLQMEFSCPYEGIYHAAFTRGEMSFEKPF